MLLRWRWKGQCDRGKTGGEQFPQIELTFDGGVRKNSGACRAWTGGKRARRGSWCRGEVIAGSGRGYGVVLWLVHGGADRCATEQGGPQQILARGCSDGQVQPQEVLRGV